MMAVRDNLLAIYDYFSVDLLLKTLFSPWRQISAAKVSGNVEIQLRALFDNLVSRVIGATVRTIVMVIGSATLVVMSFIGLVRIALWPLVPILPVVFVLLAMMGWVPWKI